MALVKTNTIALGYASNCTFCRDASLENFESLNEQVGLSGIVLIVFTLAAIESVLAGNPNRSVRHSDASGLGTFHRGCGETSTLGVSNIDVCFRSRWIGDLSLLALDHRIRSSTQFCERPTGLTGDILSIRVQFTYPILCYSSDCRVEYDQTIKAAFRKNLANFPIHVDLSDGQSRDVQLKFCSYHNIIN